MNTNKIKQHARKIARFDKQLELSAGIHAEELLLAMIDAGAAETPNGNYKFAESSDYRQARRDWIDAYGTEVGWAPGQITDNGKPRRNPGDNRFSSLNGTEFDPKTGDPTPEERAAAAAAAAEENAEPSPLDELNAERAELLKAFNKAIRKNENDAAHKITDKLLALELAIAATKV